MGIKSFRGFDQWDFERRLLPKVYNGYVPRRHYWILRFLKRFDWDIWYAVKICRWELDVDDNIDTLDIHNDAFHFHRKDGMPIYRNIDY